MTVVGKVSLFLDFLNLSKLYYLKEQKTFLMVFTLKYNSIQIMKQIFYLILSLALFASCNNKRGFQDTISFETIKYEEKSKLTDLPESKVTVEVPVAVGDSVVATHINNKIYDAVCSVLGGRPTPSNDYTALLLDFIGKYESFITEFPTSSGGWEAIVKVTVVYDTPELLNLKLDSYTITGGAHGNTVVSSFIFDPETGRELFLKDLVKDVDALVPVAEREFRKKYNIAPEESINSTGLMFADDQFTLPKNIFITEKGLLLYYNTYEIAAYADGTKEVELPYKEIKDYLAIEIK